MRLKRLELQGFKSFMDRTILDFERGITGVVGPNGCGKSNIVDAIMWVMGEQSAKHLRGESMSDVIFSGSEGKAAMSMAEVSLVMEAKGINLPSHLVPYLKGDEVIITRRLYRDGTAEYLLNKLPCRLKDIHEVFMDTGLGRRAYSVIEQGQIDRMINVKPEDRRLLFEEVAGITKYRAKKKEALRKLEATRMNLERVQDIVAELEKQMRSLKIQASRAQKYKEIKVELETVDLYVLGRKLFDLKTRVDALEAEKNEMQSSRSELDAKVAKTEAELTQLDVKRIDQEKELTSLDERDRNLALLVQRLENQIALIEEQKKHLATSIADHETEINELSGQLEKVDSEIGQVRSEKASLEGSLSDLEGGIDQLQTETEQVQSNRAELRSEGEQLEAEIAESSRKEVQLKSQLENNEQKQTERQEERKTLNQSLTETVVLLDSQKEGLREIDTKIQDVLLRSKAMEEELTQLHSDVQQTSEKLSQMEEALFKRREEFHQRKSRLESLQELQQNLEGYSPTAREVLSQLEENAIEALPLAEVLNPDAEVEDHLESLLGDSMNTLLVRTKDEAQRLARLIKEKDLERVGILSQEELTSPGPNVNFEALGMSPVSLKTRVQVKAGYENVADRWLAHVYLCKDIAELFDFRSRFPQCTFMTEDGRAIAHRDGLFHVGSVNKKTGIFARKREIEELTTECDTLQRELENAQNERETVLKQLESQEQLHAERKESLSTLHIQHVEFRKEREKLQATQDRTDKDYMGLVERSETCSKVLDELRAEKERWEADLQKLGEDREAAQSSLEENRRQIETADAKVEDLVQSLQEKKIERSKLDERVQAMDQRVVQLTESQSQISDRKNSISEALQNERQQRETIGQQQQEVAQQKSSSEEERNEVMTKLSDLKTTHGETCTQLGELRIQKDEISKEREQLVDRAQEIEVSLTQALSDFEHQKNISLERYQREAQPIGPTEQGAAIDIEKLPLFKSQLKIEWEDLPSEDRMSLLDEHIVNLRKKAERYGAVNLAAIHEYEEVEKRHGFLTTQKEDLENSIKMLEDAIVRIDDTTRTRFEETLIGVNEKFREVFPILFNGGKAELSLVDPNNILESGVDIMVQPPGKRLQSISLLSGGEKALTAVSLILAIFARKPSPFCLLDEVDAPLDDANVSRFNTVIQHMATKSQFILITHNRRTMEMADALYGVTMERAGISKMTSVRLH